MARPATKAAAAITTTPPGQELTGEQLGTYGMFSFGSGLGTRAPDPGTFETYRRMRTDPTITMARAVAMAPIKSAGWSWQADDDAPAEASQFVQDSLDKLVPSILRDLCFALDYGFQTAELVWGSKAGAWVVERWKPLLPELTTIRVEKTGQYAGLEQRGVIIDPFRAFLFTNDREGDNHYGTARHEAIREHAWAPWVESAKRCGQYFAKAAGVIPQIIYPQGSGKDKTGATIDNFEIANRVLAELGSGKGVTMPWSMQKWAEQALARGGDPMELMAWRIQFLETRAGHGSEFLENMRYLDSLKMRGWLVPERVALEGQHGTLAEASAHADIALSVAQETLGLMVVEINAQIVDSLLAVNFGPETAGKVRMVAAPIVNTERAYLRGLVRDVLVQPGNIDLFLETLDLDAAFDQAGLPKLREVIEQEGLQATAGGTPTDTPTPGASAPGGVGRTARSPSTPSPLAAAMIRANGLRRSGYGGSIFADARPRKGGK